MRNHILSNTICISRRLFKPLIGIAALFLTQAQNNAYAATSAEISCKLPTGVCTYNGLDSHQYDPDTCGKNSLGQCAADLCDRLSYSVTPAEYPAYKDTISNKLRATSCVNDVNYCSCASYTSYTECNTGYYGTATYSTLSDGSIFPTRQGCTACPDGATCMGGNNSTYTCNSGRYHNPNAASGQYCPPCPANATCNGGTETFKCMTGFYAASGTICATCPTQSGYSGNTTAGATSINQCYLQGASKPAWGSAEYSGQYYCSSNAYYQQ